jgi:hypothetical protein
MAVELGLDRRRELNSDRWWWRAMLGSGSSTWRRRPAWHRGVLGWHASIARAGRSAQLGRGHGCGALTREENREKGWWGAWTCLHWEGAQHSKQVVKETEYHDVRAQLNKIKFTTILIFIPSKRYLPSLNKFGEKYLVIDCESRNKFGYWNFFQNSMDFELFTRFRVKAGLTEICSNKLVATTIANLSKLKVGQRVLHDDP